MYTVFILIFENELNLILRLMINDIRYNSFGIMLMNTHTLNKIFSNMTSQILFIFFAPNIDEFI